MKRVADKLRLLLVKNYIQQTYNSDNVYIYTNVSDDLKYIKRDIQNMNIGTKTIFCLIEFIEDVETEMIQNITCVVKDRKLKFDKIQVLKNILTLTIPDNTQLLYLIVPKSFLSNDELMYSISSFDELKATVDSCDDEVKYKLFNRLMNDLTFNDKSIIHGMETIIRDAKYNQFTLMFGNRDITNEQLQSFTRNLSLLSVKIVNMETLTSLNLKSEHLKDFACFIDNQ